jgi:uncharacterized protein (TIGR03437 family)
MRRIVMVLAGALALGAMAYGQTPTITAVLDAATNTPDIAQGGIFIVKGTNMSGPGYVPASAPPLVPTIPGTGVKITFAPAAGGASTDAFMFYVFNQGGVNQLAALAPSKLAPGSYNVTVTYNGVPSAPATANIVQRKFGLLASDGTGTGLAVIQNYISQQQLDVNRFTTFSTGSDKDRVTYSPAKPGQTLIAWGIGLGPITGDDSQAPGAVDFRSQVDIKVIVGGVSISPLYAGRSPSLPGADQVNFILPSDIPTGCTTTFQVSVGGRLSNQTFIAITPNGSANVCTLPGFTPEQLTKLDQGGSYVAGNFNLTQLSLSMGGFSAKTESASGAFTSYKGTQISNLAALGNSNGACYVFRRTGKLNDLIYGPTSNDLDAGVVTLNGPNVSNQAFTKGPDNSYSLSLGTAFTGGSSPKITQGTYTVSGAGGADVGKFTASVTVGPPLTLNADLPTSVPRAQALSIGWTGGNASDTVAIMGMSGSQVGGTSSDPIFDAGVFICTTTADKQSLTVPASILGQLPATPAANGSGILMVQSATQVTPTNGGFTAQLVKGGNNIDAGMFQASTGSMQQTTYK